ncbi:MAG TPA: hypothetical protein VL989_00615 [Candidatus Sulfotelmatobacter sp.]|nr:hypothetical protein [Candidatus Sulfotelmatobacter sp.]
MLLIIPMLVGVVLGPLVGFSLSRRVDVTLLVYAVLGFLGALSFSLFTHIVVVAQKGVNYPAINAITVVSSFIGAILVCFLFGLIYENKAD